MADTRYLKFFWVDTRQCKRLQEKQPVYKGVKLLWPNAIDHKKCHQYVNESQNFYSRYKFIQFCWHNIIGLLLLLTACKRNKILSVSLQEIWNSVKQCKFIPFCWDNIIWLLFLSTSCKRNKILSMSLQETWNSVNWLVNTWNPNNVCFKDVDNIQGW